MVATRKRGESPRSEDATFRLEPNCLHRSEQPSPARGEWLGRLYFASVDSVHWNWFKVLRYSLWWLRDDIHKLTSRCIFSESDAPSMTTTMARGHIILIHVPSMWTLQTVTRIYRYSCWYKSNVQFVFGTLFSLIGSLKLSKGMLFYVKATIVFRYLHFISIIV